MMNSELINVFDYIEREKGIKRDVLIRAVESSLLSASRKSLGAAQNPSVNIDSETGDIKVFEEAIIVEEATGLSEISIKDAKKIDVKAKIGGTILVEITPKNFGRIAAQTAKQVIIQKIREAEKEIIFNDFKDRQGDIITGIVRRFEKGSIIVDLGKTEAAIPYREQVQGEHYQPGSRIQGYVLAVEDSSRFPEIIISRTHPGFVKRLFELEVPEISDGIVVIKAIAREAGARTKIAVYSQDEKVDSVGACVGMRGDRVKNIVRELGGEKIDIVRWDPEIAVFVKNALSPAKLKDVKVREKEQTVEVFVNDDQLSLAIGKKGQNARLTSKLTGWKIDINRDLGLPDEADLAEIDKKTKKQSSPHPVSELKGVGEKMTTQLTEAGYITILDIANSKEEELAKVPGVAQKKAETLIEFAKSFMLNLNSEKK
ncbi:MAG: transcription termination factor NusA [Candidatus Theseobacter exili]|nr:transcription termination factor NusA [Candidatus Theseobacter exili]